PWGRKGGSIETPVHEGGVTARRLGVPADGHRRRSPIDSGRRRFRTTTSSNPRQTADEERDRSKASAFGAALVEAGQAVVRDRLPDGRVRDELASLHADAGITVDHSHPDQRDL